MNKRDEYHTPFMLGMITVSIIIMIQCTCMATACYMVHSGIPCTCRLIKPFALSMQEVMKCDTVTMGRDDTSLRLLDIISYTLVLLKLTDYGHDR